MEVKSLAGAVPKPVIWKGRTVGLKYVTGAWLCYHTGCLRTFRRGDVAHVECKRCGIFSVHPGTINVTGITPGYFGPDVRPWDAGRRD